VVRRKLTGVEMCKVRDISEEIASKMSSGDIVAVCQDNEILPMKVAIRVVHALSTCIDEPLVEPERKKPRDSQGLLEVTNLRSDPRPQED
jgi:hypothetical protein